uniref:Disease resistance R13L4/SHOC-2-like LRR domain-containing protein n=1 Tax=Arundo donax TaxID=35708 RepID=A0A0A8YLD3_ARUDO
MNVPSWVGLLVNLQKLEINVGEVGQDDIRILGGLPALHYLSVCLGLTGRVHAEISSTSGFTCLRHFHIGGNQCGLGLMFEPGSMPKLEELVLEFDAFETGHLCNLDFAFGVEHLLSLTNIRCDISSLGEIMPPSKAVMVAMERVVSVHPNHPKLTINILG